MPRKNKYFGIEEEEAIISFKNSNSHSEKIWIFNEILKDPFLKMIESILNKYKLYDARKEYRNMIDDCLSFVYERIDKYDETRLKCKKCKEEVKTEICPHCGGKAVRYKAYSFFGTIIKRYLISERNKGMDNTKDSIEPNDNIFEERDDLNSYILSDEIENYEMKEFFEYLKYYFNDIKHILCSSSSNMKLYEQMHTSFMILLEDPADLPFYNKKAVCRIMKELTGIETASLISEFFSTLTDYYYTAKYNYYNGEV